MPACSPESAAQACRPPAPLDVLLWACVTWDQFVILLWGHLAGRLDTLQEGALCLLKGDDPLLTRHLETQSWSPKCLVLLLPSGYACVVHPARTTAHISSCAGSKPCARLVLQTEAIFMTGETGRAA